MARTDFAKLWNHIKSPKRGEAFYVIETRFKICNQILQSPRGKCSLQTDDKELSRKASQQKSLVENISQIVDNKGFVRISKVFAHLLPMNCTGLHEAGERLWQCNRGSVNQDQRVGKIQSLSSLTL